MSGMEMTGGPAVAPDGSVYIATSYFSVPGFPSLYRVYRLAGSEWTTLEGEFNQRVNALAVGPDGSLYAGGTFTTIDGVSMARVARWTGTAWESVGAGVSGGGSAPGSFVPHVNALAFATDGSLYVGGLFLSAGGQPAGGIARWDGTEWHTLSGGLQWGSHPAARVRVLLPALDGGVYVGGDFHPGGAVPAGSYHVARWTGTEWLNLGSGIGGEVHALTFAPDGSLLAGGDFTAAGGVSGRRHVARWNGTDWEALRGGTDGPVHALDTRGDVVLVGGSFKNGGQVHSPFILGYRFDTPPTPPPPAISGWSLEVTPSPAVSSAVAWIEAQVQGSVRLSLMDAAGRELRVLLDGSVGAGRTPVALPVADLAAGVYFLRLSAGGKSARASFVVSR